MHRPSRAKTAARALVASLILSPAPAAAQDLANLSGETEPVSAEAYIAEANRLLGLGKRVGGCHGGDSGEIVVCARIRLDPRFEPVAPLPQEAKMVALGAPPVGGGVGAGVTIRGCFLQKCPKELYFIDLKAIPEPPPGSDAEMMALGLMRAP